MKLPVEGSLDPPRRAFVAVRPPGHHCGENTPCGFCFVNNVAVGAAHGRQEDSIKRLNQTVTSTYSPFKTWCQASRDTGH